MKKMDNYSIRFSKTNLETIPDEHYEKIVSELNETILKKCLENNIREQESIEFAKKFHCP